MYEQDTYGRAVPQMQALAFIYDHLNDFPSWVQRLTSRQLEQLAGVLTHWQTRNGPDQIVRPIGDIQKREFTRALVLSKGDVCEAAKALGIGKTTLYRRLKEWGYSPSDWRAFSQAGALACIHSANDDGASAARAAGFD